MQVAYIYCITNTVNQKKYIGKTTKRDPRTRWKQHLQAARFKDTAVAYSTANTMPIVRAIRKYGEDKFNFKVIEECTEHVVNEREEYYIKEYNTADGSGYNCTYGGEGVSKPKKYWSNHPHSKAVSCYTLDGKCIVACDKEYYRPLEVDTLLGNANKAKKKLNWRAKINIQQLVTDMVDTELKNLSKNEF